MKINLGWNDDYLIGVEEIDVQHKKFLRLISEIYQFAGNSEDSQESLKLVAELRRYVRFHFDSEELLMKTYSYPNRAEQIREHNNLIDELDGRIERLKAGQGNIVELVFFLTKWFIDHDLYFDKKFGVFFSNNKANI